MSLKFGSALVGLSLAACLGTVGAVSVPSQAAAQKVVDCSSLDVNSQAWVNCARKKTREIRSNVQKHEDECDRGGCGPKARAIQKKVDKQSKGNTWQAIDADDEK
jgi:hypothetical protein